MFRNILVCVDASPQGERALSQAIELAECGRSRLTILTVVPRPPCWATTPMTAASIEPLAVELREEATRAQCEAVDRVPDCVPVTKILTGASLRAALAAQLRAGDHDLVVIPLGRHVAWFGGWRDRLTIAWLRRHEVPVLVVRAEQPAARVARPEPEPRLEPVAQPARRSARLRARPSA